MLFARTTEVKLTRYRLYGERCSGTNFVRALIERNLPELAFSNSYNWEKHDFVNPAHCPEDEMALVVVRGALDWLRSLHRNPHQVGPWFRPLGISEFIRHEWSSIFNTQLVHGQVAEETSGQEFMNERHPVTGARIANVVELRNLKIRSQMKVRNLYRSWMIVRYEEVRDDPEVFVGAVARLSRQSVGANYIGIDEDLSQPSGAGRRHLPYAEFAPRDFRFIAATLDLAQERRLGFQYPELKREQVDSERRFATRYQG